MKKIRHVVLFEIKENVTENQARELVERLNSFSKIQGVLDVRTGLDFAGRSEFKVAFTCDFESRDALTKYIDHPDHMKVVNEYLPTVVKLGWKVVDFEFEI